MDLEPGESRLPPGANTGQQAAGVTRYQWYATETMLACTAFSAASDG